MSKPADSTRESRLAARVRGTRRALRRAGAVSVGLAVASLLLGGAGLALLLSGSVAWRSPGAGPLLLDLILACAGGALAALLARRWVRGVDERAIATDAERARGLSAGEISGALELRERLPAGASRALAERAERDALAQLGSPGLLAPALARRARRRLALLGAAAASLAVALLTGGFAAPDAARAGFGAMFQPIRHLRGPVLPPVQIHVDAERVPRGAVVGVTVQAPGRDHVVLAWRPRPGLPVERMLSLRQGTAQARVGPIEAPTGIWLRAPDGATSDTLLVMPEEPLLLTGLTVEAIYPSYLGRPAETFARPLPAMMLPAGTTLRIDGRATAALASARLARSPRDTVGLAVTGAAFAGEWTPRVSGRFDWELVDETGRELATAPAALDVTLVPDSAPVVRITYPGTDTVVPSDMRLPIVADATDDHGLGAAELVGWRISPHTGAGAVVRTPLDLDTGAGQALLRLVLPLDTFRLMPGDTLRYYAAATDRSPRRQQARSRTYALVFPSMRELRSSVSSEAGRLSERARDMAMRAEELARRTRDESRQMANAGGAGHTRRDPNAGGSRLDAQQAGELEQVVRQEQALLDDVDAMREQLESLRRGMEAAGLSDPQIQERMRELQELYEQALSEDLRRQVQALDQALESMDPERVQRALERLAQEQDALRQRLDRSLELFRRAATEQRMKALAQDARELAARQEAIAGGLADSASAARAAEEQQGAETEAERLASRADSLAGQLDALEEAGSAQAAQSAGERMRSASETMARARRQSTSGELGRAGEQGRSAAQQMTEAAQQLEAARQEMSEEWREDARRAVEQATQDVLSIAQAQEDLRNRIRAARTGRAVAESGHTHAGAQATLQQSLETVGRNLADAGQRSALVGQEVGAALGRAMLRMRATQQLLAQGARVAPEQKASSAAQAVEALNALALELLKNAERIAQSQGGTGLQQAMEQMTQLAQQQGSINSQTGQMMPLALPSPAMSAQLRGLASQQRAIARGLEQVEQAVGERGDMLGRIEGLAAEADALARQMEQGALPPDARARQERLFHRLLDAGRSLEKDETADRREAERARTMRPPADAVLDPSLMRGPRYQPPSDEQLRRLSPEYRRLILEYFDRLNRTGAPAGSANDEREPQAPGRGEGG